MILTPMAVVAQASAPTPAPDPDPAVSARAKEWFHRLQTGTLDRSQMTQAASDRLSEVAEKWYAQNLGELGDPVSFERYTDPAIVDSTNRYAPGPPGSHVYIYRVRFKNRDIGADFRFCVDDASGKISELSVGLYGV